MRYRHFTKYFLLILIGFFLFVNQPFVIANVAISRDVQRTQAQLLTKKGNEQLRLANPIEALDYFKEATKIYQQLNYDEGVTGSLINQNLALQALGLNSQACTTLLLAFKIKSDDWLCNPSSEQSDELIENSLAKILDQQSKPPIYLLGIHNLGNVLRQLGKLDESEIILQKIILLAKQTSSNEITKILLSLANTKRYKYKRLKDRYTDIEEPIYQQKIVNTINQKALETIGIYQQIIKDSNSSFESIMHSQVYQLSLLIDFKQWLKIVSTSLVNFAEQQSKTEKQIQQSINSTLKISSLFSELSPSQFVYTKLNFANSLSQIPDNDLHTVAIQYAKSALKVAQDMNNQRLESESLGILGKLQNDSDKARSYFEKALNQAQQIRAWDLAYQWQGQLGALYKKQSKQDKALEMYKAAVTNLQRVRNDLLSTNIDLQYSFYETVDPIYRDYLKLLIANSDLKNAIQTNEQFQIAELENFLKCGKLELIALNKIQKLNNYTVIHVIDLESSIEVITQSPDQSLHHYSVNPNLIRDSVESLLEALQDNNFYNTQESVLISHSQIIYNQLIKPIKKYLPPSGTLVFTLDKSFQSIPMSLLHDGKDYLIKQYSITTTLGSQIRPPKILSEQQRKALIAGLSKISPSFNATNVPENIKPLPEVEQEIASINKQINSSVMLNEKFTSQRFKRELNRGVFPVVHITTHGQFSSDPERTILLAWDKPISIRELDGWLKAQQNQDPIELLILSACQTAKGNKRSTLGITGIAVQAGARSVIASLWLVDSTSTAMLAEKFYRSVNHNLIKAESLRQAQLSLLSDPQYHHPYYWAAFILVGSWL
ncbi:CHAT domain-containing protein [Nostoc sp. FACHB-280]|nr:CHAT domain-containing protein [Nostoc sp. FACHB-280]